MPASRVLLVDDDEAVLQLATSTLAREGLRIVTATSPSRALDAGRQVLSYDVVLSSLAPPEMSGFVFREAYRRQVGHRTPFVFLGDPARAKEIEPLLEGDRFLAKPFSPADLRRTVYASIGLVHVTAGPLPGQLDRVLADIEEQRGTGVITAVRGASMKRVVVQEGAVVFAFSNDPRDLIGQAFLRAGLIGEKDLLAAFEEARVIHGGPALAGALAGLRKVTPDQSRAVFERKIRESVLDLFLWPAGAVEFVESTLTEADHPFPIRLSMGEIRDEGALRRRRWNAVRETLPDPMVRFVRTGRSWPDGFPKTGGEKRLIELVERGASFGEMLVEFRGEDYAVGLRLADLVKRVVLTTAAPAGWAPPDGGSPASADDSTFFDDFESMFAELAADLPEPYLPPVAAPEPEPAPAIAASAFARALAMFRGGDFIGARSTFLTVLAADPMNRLARQRLEEVERAIVADARKRGWKDDTRIELAASVASLRGRTDVRPNDAFVLSRIAGGRMTVGDLIHLCPFPEHELFEILRRFETEGLLRRA